MPEILGRGAGRTCVLLVAVALVWAVGSARAGADVLSWSAPVGLDSGMPLSGVSCPSSAQCTAVDAKGREVTFDPATQAVNAAGVKDVDGSHALTGVSCPASAQCTAVDQIGHEVTFDPTSGSVNAAGTTDVDATYALDGVSCPSTSQCTAVEEGSQEVTFDPVSGNVNAAGVQNVAGDNPNGPALFAVSCPASSQCTAAYEVGGAYTFDPGSGALIKKTDSVGGLADALSCPSTSQCTAVIGNGGDTGAEITFNPQSGASDAGGLQYIDGTWSAPPAHEFDGHAPLGVSCPSSSQCTLVDASGDEVTFDPIAPHGAALVAIKGAAALDAVSCPSVSDCVAVDSAGKAFVGSASPRPLATTVGARGIRARSAVLRGRLDTGSQAVSWQFQFGLSRHYGEGSVVRAIPAGHTRPKVVTWKLTGLRPKTRYHYRLVAFVSAGVGLPVITSYGRDLSVTTR